MIGGEHARVVARAMDAARVRRHAVLLEALRALADRAGEEDAGDGGALPPRRLDGQLAGPEGRDPELGQVDERGHEAGRRDRVVDLDREVRAAVGPSQVDGQPPVGGPLDPVGRGVEHADPTAEDVVLVRLDVPGADTDQRLGIDRQPDLRRRRDDELARPRQQAGGQLEARVLLADDQDPAVGVLLDRADVGVVMGVLHPDPGRGVRLGHADRDDQHPRGVRAIGRLDLEPVAVGGRHLARARPAGAVAHLDPGALGEQGEVRLHLRTRREVRRAVHERRLEGARVGLVTEQAVPVIALVRRAAANGRGMRLRPRQEPLEERPAPEHPTG